MVSGSAFLSEDRRYRYALWRTLGAGSNYVMFIGLNPSTADETNDDPTIRRCINFAKDWGYDALCMCNLFAFRATLPKDMIAARDPVGPMNDGVIRFLSANASMVVAAWGVYGRHINRDNDVMNLIENAHYLKLNSDGTPSHPLYLPKISTPIPYNYGLR